MLDFKSIRIEKWLCEISDLKGNGKSGMFSKDEISFRTVFMVLYVFKQQTTNLWCAASVM